MPDIRLKNQPFDVVFHPQSPVIYGAILTGEVKAFRYDEEGEASTSWSVRPTRRAARAISVEASGDSIWVGAKSGALIQLGAMDGSIKSEREAHETAINRVACISPQLVVSGDDDGVIKFWDPRQPDCIRTYSQHYDYISDFAYFDDKRQLVATSGDGHLSVIDIRSNKPSPLSISDDQEDELLSIVPIKNDTKAIVGSALGILSIWNRNQGWGDCVDRIPGHPASIDALVALTPDIIASGSEDGMIRVTQIQPHKFLGVIATHEEYPIERLALDYQGHWLGSVSHDECIKLTDVQNLFEESENEDSDTEPVTSKENDDFFSNL
ncbi:WD40-repeat-containing domain protein [Naematelia encephala]|uniref:WD repeat-containing protein JIP5 n=1 Tax=Naematelia encephala TaxID=71784 RepID=A0A1Y2AKG1_9TREE|nr:WD40-repeat-containing domain protein [Naematelia encephala]